MTAVSEWPLDAVRRLRDGQRSEVWVANVADRSARLVHATDGLLLEAPNWAPDGEGLLLNGDGLLWRLGLQPTVQLTQVVIDNLPPINNDHVLHGERGLVYLSANDGHIYVAPIEGGAAARVTHDSSRYHFLHGVSPDGDDIGVRRAPRAATSPPPAASPPFPRQAARRSTPRPEPRTWTAPSTHQTEPGSTSTPRSSAAGWGTHSSPGYPSGGGPMEQLVTSDTVDWFPHVSPDGQFASYISFPTGTLGHPADLDVEVRLVRTSDWAEPRGAVPGLRRAGNSQRQQLVARQPRVCVRGLPHRAREVELMTETGNHRRSAPASANPDRPGADPWASALSAPA